MMSEREHREVNLFGLGRMAIHGQIDLASHMASYFSFGRTDDAMPEEGLVDVPNILTPFLRVALTRVASGMAAIRGFPKLTPVEQTLLTWVAAGCTNAEIANIRGRTTATVRNQLHTEAGPKKQS